MIDAFSYLRSHLDEEYYPDELVEHIVICSNGCDPFGEEVFVCGIGEHIRNPEEWDAKGNYRRIYGPPVPFWLQKELIRNDESLSDWDKSMRLSTLGIEEAFIRHLARPIWSTQEEIEKAEEGVEIKYNYGRIRLSGQAVDHILHRDA